MISVIYKMDTNDSIYNLAVLTNGKGNKIHDKNI